MFEQRQPQFNAPAQQTVQALVVWAPSNAGEAWIVAYNGSNLYAACADDTTPGTGDIVACRWVGRSAGSPTGTLLISQVISKASATEGSTP